jgi:hypothetical protein
MQRFLGLTLCTPNRPCDTERLRLVSWGSTGMTAGIMAKKKAGPKMMTTTTAEPAVWHARIELPDDDCQRLKSAAKRSDITEAACIRRAVLERIKADERNPQ